MSSRFPKLDLTSVRTISFQDRRNKVEVGGLAKTHAKGGTFAEFFDSLPRILAGQELREVVKAIVEARRKDRPFIVTMGAHVVKVGLSPILIDLMKRGIVTSIATNGAGAIHDVELAMFGATSEDVSAGIASGEFGMVRESCALINAATKQAAESKRGLGETLGAALCEAKAPYCQHSILANASEIGMPVTVHVAIGSDINHMHPDFDGAAAGAATQTDFQIFAAQVANLKGGVLMNIGSSVLLPTVIEKAIAVCRNLKHDVSDFVGVNLDFNKHYRSGWNPVRRAEELGGKGYTLVGHHEILMPLIAAAVLERWDR